MWSLVTLVALAPFVALHELARWGAARALHAPASLRWSGVRIAASRGKRAVAALAGLAASYLACAALAFAHFDTRGIDIGPTYIVVEAVKPGFDAAGKLAPGDIIRAV